ncbi:unnamed protein product, partial [marine sediment metagenome]
MGFLDALDPNSSEWMGYFAQSLQVAGVIFWTLLGVAVVGVFWYFISFNIPTHVYETVGKEQTLRFLRKTRSRIKTKDNVSKLKIFGIKEDCEPPTSDQYQ